MLEAQFFQPGIRRENLYAFTPPRAASREVVALDRLTLQAVTGGSVLLPHGRVISAVVWMRALRSLIDELIRPVYTLARSKQIIVRA
ncbi:hypothetical protein [Ensifer sp. SL37]|nr:hypothetical protein [Ensifer sp. SL37]MCY1740840.1 hypothetical protein [Ensifer sp. SL37]